jgi:uncharacterized RDD family membrane protein YckC
MTDPTQPSPYEPSPPPADPPPSFEKPSFEKQPPPAPEYPAFPGQHLPPAGDLAPPPPPGPSGGAYPPPPPQYGQQPPPGYGQQPPPAYGQQPPPGYGQPGQYGGYPAAPMATGYGTPGLNLPPGVVLAPVGRRIGAFFLSYLLVIVTLGIGYLIWGLTLWGKGTSPALKVLGMKVWVVDENRPATFGKMALRDIVGRIVDGIASIITALVSFIMFVSGDKHQSLHDKVAGTTVVYDPNKVLG